VPIRLKEWLLHAVSRHRYYLFGLGILQVAFALFILFFPKGAVFYLLDPFHGPYCDRFFLAVNVLGEWPAYLIAAAVLIPRYRWRGVLLMICLAVCVPLVSRISKTFLARPRPALYFAGSADFAALQRVDGVPLLRGRNSLPSGHTLSAFATFGILALGWWKYRTLVSICLVLSCLAGLARIYLLQHFVEDVWLGSLLGAILALGFFGVLISPKMDKGEGWERLMK